MSLADHRESVYAFQTFLKMPLPLKDESKRKEAERLKQDAIRIETGEPRRLEFRRKA